MERGSGVKNENIERGEKNSSLRVFGFSGSENERKIIELFISCSPFANCARDFHHFVSTSSCDFNLCWWLMLSRKSFFYARKLRLLSSHVCRCAARKAKRKIVLDFIFILQNLFRLSSLDRSSLICHAHSHFATFFSRDSLCCFDFAFHCFPDGFAEILSPADICNERLSLTRWIIWAKGGIKRGKSSRKKWGLEKETNSVSQSERADEKQKLIESLLINSLCRFV